MIWTGAKLLILDPRSNPEARGGHHTPRALVVSFDATVALWNHPRVLRPNHDLASPCGQRAPRSVVALACAAAFAACAGAAADQPPPRRVVSALSFAASPRLLPRAAVSRPAAVEDAVPAFDRAHVGSLERGRSYSIGTTSAGYLVGAVPLAGSTGLALRPISVTRGAIYGTRALEAMLTRAADAVAARYPGSVLWAGDLSGPRGGDLPGHKSHNSGRDVDLGFYRRAPDGTAADTPRFSAVTATTGGGADRFDLERNWLFVASVLQDPGATVQWIFVAAPLREALLDYARTSGADPELIARAEQVLAQPSDSSAHRDHFHLRIYCGLEEALEGCLDAPPLHPWAPRWDAEIARLVDGYTPLLSREGPDELRLVVERLVRLHAKSAIPALQRLATESADATIQGLAADAVAFLSGRETPAAWARWRPDDDAGE